MKKSNHASDKFSLGLMAAIILFGAGSAYMVLKSPSTADIGQTAAAVAEPRLITKIEPPAPSGPKENTALPNNESVVSAAKYPNSDVEKKSTAKGSAQALPSPTASLKLGPPHAATLKPSVSAVDKPVATKTQAPHFSESARVAEVPSTSELAAAHVAGHASVPPVSVNSSGSPVSSAVTTSSAGTAGPSNSAGSPVRAASDNAQVKAITAEPLVHERTRPVVVMATAQKAWVKVDDKQTVIVKKGEAVPGLGLFQGADSKSAQFDSGSYPINQSN